MRLTGCKLFGAYRTAASVRDAAVLLHSTIGCSWGTMAFHIPSRLHDIRQASSVLYEEDIVFGGGRSLEKALENMVRLYDPPVIFVVTGCVAEIMEDDIEGVLGKFSGEKLIIPVKGAGFKGNMHTGFLDAMKTLAGHMQVQAKKKNAVNLVGFFSDDFKVDADLAGIRQLLGKDIEVNAVLPYDTFDHIVKAPAAALNIVLQGFEDVGRHMEHAFGVPYVTVDYPYGLKGSRAFAEKVGRALHLDSSEELKRQEVLTVEKMEAAYDYLHQLYGLPAAVAGDAPRAAALKEFLAAELGMAVEVFCDGAAGEEDDFEERVEKSNAVILFGSSFERGLADQWKLPLIRYAYPVFDSIGISRKGYAGFEGTVNLVEDLVNVFMTADYRREGLYG